ncbi:MAG TPA: hypothetical protein VIK86_06910 [Candidatus Paceibacterota bacterium]
MDLNELKDYYNRVFAKSPKGNDKALSGISYRLAGVLIKELDFYEPKKLPQRKKLAEILNASHQAILDSLAQLESVGFIIRSSIPARIVGSDAEGIKQSILFHTEVFKSELKSRRFNDDFSLNIYYNTTEEEYIYSIYKSIIERFPQLVSVYEYISKLPKTESNKKLLNKIVNDIIDQTKDVLENIDTAVAIPFIEDILKNSKLSPLILLGENQKPFVTVHINDKNLHRCNT